MPKAAPQPEDITITVSDTNGRINAEVLAVKLKNAIELFQSVQKSFVSPDDVVRWVIVKASMKSPLTLTFRPEIKKRNRPQARTQRQVVRQCLTTLDWIDKGSTPSDVRINEDSLTAVKNLAESTDADGSTISFGTTTAKQKITLTPKTVDNVNQIIAKARKYSDFATIEGLLDVVSVRDGRKTFALTESVTKHRIDCTGAEDIFADAQLYLNQRVAVTGIVRYVNHVPKSIDVRVRIRRLKTMAELTPLTSMPPIDITGGLSSEEYVRSMRQCLR